MQMRRNSGKNSLWDKTLSKIDPEVSSLIRDEERRQKKNIILIPSESISSKAVRDALGCVFTNIYAEGYPHQRFYQGTIYADILETLTRRRIAGAFSTAKIKADKIFVNIQPLSGAAANNTIYQALLKPGDAIMGLRLTHGGHLTHGSAANRSGQIYKSLPYEIDKKTGKLNYEAIKKIARRRKPKIIVAGFSSYPWAPNWRKFREIADAAPGTFLLADISHTAGMVAAKCLPSPVGYADVIMFTTHKTLCGPRSAVILSFREEIARKINRALFPGEQGGPHVNKFAAVAAAFKIAQSPKFKTLQKKILKNAHYLSVELKSEGLRIAYGGTNTHLLLIDLKPISPYLSGALAASILESCGIVVNKNSIPGDGSIRSASSIRIGSPWITQLGWGRKKVKILAGLIKKVLINIHPERKEKIDKAILKEIKNEVSSLLK